MESDVSLQGASEGSMEFVHGIAAGTEDLVGASVGSVAGMGAKISGVISKGLATLTFDQDYQLARNERKELMANSTSRLKQSGKYLAKVTPKRKRFVPWKCYWQLGCCARCEEYRKEAT